MTATSFDDPGPPGLCRAEKDRERACGGPAVSVGKVRSAGARLLSNLKGDEYNRQLAKYSLRDEG